MAQTASTVAGAWLLSLCFLSPNAAKSDLLKDLADVLARFSIDLVKIVHAYASGWPAAFSDGKVEVLCAIGSESEADGQIGLYERISLACDPENRIWASCRGEGMKPRPERGCVLVFSTEGKLLNRVEDGHFQWPFNMAFDQQHDVAFIADTSVAKSGVFTVRRSDCQVLGKVAQFGAVGVAFDSKTRLLYVGSKVYNPASQLRPLVRRLEGKTINSGGVAINSAGEVGVIDVYWRHVQVWAQSGELLRTFTGWGPSTHTSDGCSWLAVDHADNWIVCGFLYSNVMIFKRDGTLLTLFTHPDIQYPESVCVDRDGRYYVSVRVSSRRKSRKHPIVVFGFCS